MTPPLDQLETRFAEAMARFAKEVGIVGATEGRLLARLILGDEPLTQDDLMAQVGASRGNVSTALKILAEGGFIRTTTMRGSRRAYYEAQPNLWRVTIGFVLMRIGHQIEVVHQEFLTLLEDGRDVKRNGGSAEERRNAAHLLRQVERLTTYTDGARKLLQTVRKLVGRDAV